MQQKNFNLNFKPKIALTGSIASGKTTAADFFANLGYTIIDTDEIYANLIQNNSDLVQKLALTFGANFINNCNTASASLNKEKMRQLVFADSQARDQLNSITHPEIFKEVKQHLTRLAQQPVIIMIPLLDACKQNYLAEVDFVISIETSKEIQVARLRVRNGFDAALAQSIINSQPTKKERMTLANFVINNVKNLGDLKEQILLIHQKIITHNLRES